MTTPTPHDITSAENVVAEWRAAMEGVTPGWHRDKFGYLRDGEGYEVHFRQMTNLSAGPDKSMAKAQANQRFADQCTPEAITALLDALEASQAREAAAEARVAALEAENDRLKAAAAQRLHEKIVAHTCQCDSPVIRCDGLGCRCTYCGKPERRPRQALSRSTEKNDGQ